MRTRIAPLAAAFLALTILVPGAAAAERPTTATVAAPTSAAIHVPASWGPQAMGWGDLAWFRASTGSASCLALRRDGWTILANLPWLHRLVLAAPHPAGSVAARARADLLAGWWHFGHDARALIAAGNGCPASLAGRERLARAIAGPQGGDTAPAWAHRLFELYAVLYPQGTAASCAALTAKVGWAQHDLSAGVGRATYYGRSRMTTHPARWLELLKTGATCIVSQGDGMEAGVGWGLPTLLGSARAEHYGDWAAARRIRQAFAT